MVGAILSWVAFATIVIFGILGGDRSGGGGGGDLPAANDSIPSVTVGTYHLPSSVLAADHRYRARYDTTAACGAFRARVATADQMSQHDLVWWVQGIQELGEEAPESLLRSLHELEADARGADPGSVYPSVETDLGVVQTTCTLLRA